MRFLLCFTKLLFLIFLTENHQTFGACPSSDFDCGDKCISKDKTCNGVDDCGNNKDEDTCYDVLRSGDAIALKSNCYGNWGWISNQSAEDHEEWSDIDTTCVSAEFPEGSIAKCRKNVMIVIARDREIGEMIMPGDYVLFYSTNGFWFSCEHDRGINNTGNNWGKVDPQFCRCSTSPCGHGLKQWWHPNITNRPEAFENCPLEVFRMFRTDGVNKALTAGYVAISSVRWRQIAYSKGPLVWKNWWLSSKQKVRAGQKMHPVQSKCPGDERLAIANPITSLKCPCERWEMTRFSPFTWAKYIEIPENSANNLAWLNPENRGLYGKCTDTPNWKDAQGHLCHEWSNHNCYDADHWEYNFKQQEDIMINCCASCHSCAEDMHFVDEKGFTCKEWRGHDCKLAESKWDYTKEGAKRVRDRCQSSCRMCTSESVIFYYSVLRDFDRAQIDTSDIQALKGAWRYHEKYLFVVGIAMVPFLLFVGFWVRHVQKGGEYEELLAA